MQANHWAALLRLLARARLSDWIVSVSLRHRAGSEKKTRCQRWLTRVMEACRGLRGGSNGLERGGQHRRPAGGRAGAGAKAAQRHSPLPAGPRR